MTSRTLLASIFLVTSVCLATATEPNKQPAATAANTITVNLTAGSNPYYKSFVNASGEFNLATEFDFYSVEVEIGTIVFPPGKKDGEFQRSPGTEPQIIGFGSDGRRDATGKGTWGIATFKNLTAGQDYVINAKLLRSDRYTGTTRSDRSAAPIIVDKKGNVITAK